MTIGSFVSAAALPPINAWLIVTWSWQVAWQVWGILLLLIFVPIAFFFIRNRPEDVGLLPDGQEKIVAENEVASEKDDGSWTLKEAMRTRAFWLILICVGIPSMVTTGITFHLFSILGEQGVSLTISALVLSIHRDSHYYDVVSTIGFFCTWLSPAPKRKANA
jgi:cyanate permease